LRSIRGTTRPLLADALNPVSWGSGVSRFAAAWLVRGPRAGRPCPRACPDAGGSPVYCPVENNVEKMACAEDLVPPWVPDPPRRPDPPR
jgi:hypothetical protein